MSTRPLRPIRLSIDQATELWQQSDEASAFTCPTHLQKLVDEVDWWGVELSGKILAAWPFVRDSSNGEIAPSAFLYYVGPMFSRSLRAKKYASYWSNYTACLSSLIDVVTCEYPSFKFTMPIGFTDIRVLEWWNQAHPDSLGFIIRPRYSARIDLSEFTDEKTFFKGLASDRQRLIKRWASMQAKMVDNVTPERIIELYEITLRRTGGKVTPERRDGLRRLIALAYSGSAQILGVIPSGCTEAESVSIVLDGPKETNLIILVASDNWRDAGSQVWLTWQAILRAQAKGKRWFDFNGANSPGRAADKHFYGAKAELYFDCSFGPQ